MNVKNKKAKAAKVAPVNEDYIIIDKRNANELRNTIYFHHFNVTYVARKILNIMPSTLYNLLSGNDVLNDKKLATIKLKICAHQLERMTKYIEKLAKEGLFTQ